MNKHWADEAIGGNAHKPSLLMRFFSGIIYLIKNAFRKLCIATGVLLISFLILSSLNDEQIHQAAQFKEDAQQEVDSFIDHTLIPASKRTMKSLKDWDQDTHRDDQQETSIKKKFALF